MPADEGLNERRHVLRDLARRSDRCGLGHLALHAGALAVTGVLVLLGRNGPLLWPAMLVHGIVLVFLFAPLHESVHRTAFRTRRLNDRVAFGCGLVLLLPPTWFRAFHFAHHRHTQDPERDPELAVPKPASLPAWLWHGSGLPTWWSQGRNLLRQALGRVDEPFVAARERAAVVREARLYLAVYATVGALALALQSTLPLVLWVGPALLGQPFLRLYLLAEHTGCPLVGDMLRNTRTTLTTRLVRALAWNMPYHAEHHAYPALPFHALPRAHGLLRPGIACLGAGYVPVNVEIVRRLGEPGRQTSGSMR